MTDSYRSGFVALFGRPNVGKSTLLNALVGEKVAIVSDKPQTTRSVIRGVRTTDETQLVFVDTPGVHRPRTELGKRTNQRAYDSLDGVDIVVLVLEAHAPIGPGDQFVAQASAAALVPRILVLNKVDLATPDQIAEKLTRAGAGEFGPFEAYVPVSARTGDGVDALLGELESRLEEGPQYFPPGMVSDQPEAVLAAELVREALIAEARDELPHSIAVTVDDVEERTTKSGEPLFVCTAVIRVERESQKGIVIGKGGERLKRAGIAARTQLEARLGVRVHLETRVKVERDWQRRPNVLDRMGF